MYVKENWFNHVFFLKITLKISLIIYKHAVIAILFQ